MENYFNAVIRGLKDIIGIPSVESAPAGDKPFGENVYKALDYMLKLGESLGFKTVNYDNYIGEIVWGESEKSMGILCHLDVVPAGRLSDWKYPPFSATEADGKIYGRGATDDKSPAVVCLYCMKALKDEGFVPKRTIKLILGCNEESGWKCIKHYNKVAKMPDYGFSPDADFPVLYAEKGILHVKFAFDYNKNLKSISGGERANVVCDFCEAEAPFIKEFAEQCGVAFENGKLVTKGKTAHGSTPEKGKNAILPMITYLEKAGCIDGKIREYLFEDKLGLKNLSDDTGNLTMSPDIINIENGKLAITVDIRYPSTKDGNKIIEQLKEIAPFAIKEHQLPLYNDKNSFLVTTLLKIYNDTMETNCEPKAIGGGTYARALPEGTAFGPESEGDDNRIHDSNESVTLENLKLQFIMYKKAIKELSK